MILPTIESFERVTGDIDKIRLDVDVMPNRTGREKKVLYGKDLAALMEHSCVRHFMLSGGSIRGKTISEVPDYSPSSYEREFPARFSRTIDAGIAKRYLPFRHHTEGLSATGQASYFSLKYCTSLPTLPDFSFTNDPIVTECSGYDYHWTEPEEDYPLRLEHILDPIEDMKKQQFAFIEPIWVMDDDGVKTFDRHGPFESYSIHPFYYYAEDWRPNVEDVYGDGWWIVDNTSGPLTITYPTAHIAKAQIWVDIGPIRSVYDRYDYYQGEERIRVVEDFDVERFVFKMDESTNGTLTIDQNKIINGIKTAVERTGHSFQTMDTVRRGHSGSGHGSFNLTAYPGLTAVFQFDNHTKWW